MAFQDKAPLCILFVDDIVKIEETKDGVEHELEKYRDILES